MLVAALVSILGLAGVLYAVYRERPLPAPGPTRPDWALSPTPADIVRSEFPLTFPGYDPASVEMHLEAVAHAYADLLAVAPPEIVDRARQRTAARLGAPPPPPVSTALAQDSPPAADSDDVEALRAEAALAALSDPGEVPVPETHVPSEGE